MTPSPGTIRRKAATISPRRRSTAGSGAGISMTARASPAGEAQPWRALSRGLALLITKTRPLRRTTRQFLSRFFRDLSELTIFISAALQQPAAITALPADQPGQALRRDRLPARPDLAWIGAVEKTRTSTEFPPQRPQRCASTNSATTARLGTALATRRRRAA